MKYNKILKKKRGKCSMQISWCDILKKMADVCDIDVDEEQPCITLKPGVG